MDETLHVASNPSSSTTPLIKSQLHNRHHQNFDDLLNEYGYRKYFPNERRPFEHSPKYFNEWVPSIVHEVFPQPNNVVHVPPQIFQCTEVDVNLTPSIDDLLNLSHGWKSNPKCIQVDERTLSSMKGKIPQCTIRHHYSQIIKKYIEPKSYVGKFQLFLSFLKYKSFAIVRRISGIKKLENTKSRSHIVKYLFKTFMSICKKYHSKYCNVACCILVESIVNRSTRQNHLIKCT